MKKNVRVIALAAAGAAGAVCAETAVHAALYRPKKREAAPIEEEFVDMPRYTQTLQEAIRCRTVSDLDEDRVDWAEFEKLHALLETRYPLIRKTLTREKVGRAGLLYTWQGTDPDLKPIALIGHQDVVPVPPEKLTDWLFEKREFDAFEVLGGERYYEQNGFQTASLPDAQSHGFTSSPCSRASRPCWKRAFSPAGP